MMKKVVRLVLSEEDNSEKNGEMKDDEEGQSDMFTLVDVRKMKSIGWLSFHEEHMGDALVFANALLRQFLLAGKINSANVFVSGYLPEDVMEKAATGTHRSNTTPEAYVAMAMDVDTESYSN